MLEGCKLDPKLINTLVERWRLETYTFHFLCSKCIITLEDMVLQFDLPVDGLVVTGAVIVPNKENFFVTLLGTILNKFKGGQISTNWKLSLGSAVLAMLYWELCRAIELDKNSISDWLLLLQSWAYWRLPFLRPRTNDLYIFLLVTRYIFRGFDVPHILHLHANIDADPNVRPDADACTVTDDDTDIDANSVVDVSAGSMSTHSGFIALYNYMPVVTQTLSTILFYYGGSSVQPFVGGVEDT
ncbi:hypothetical protein PVK06_005128 [Gossypium arboreum]|uniref:Aminotransferase-like plant mobile domain-containing protein n=1 Tax=Gossypium arboreum TaxID=29729 RepID=A0ABR0QTT1_GOSAR|nr:hypothetical protein PVK06_005128 [Gossypium arboreum]